MGEPSRESEATVLLGQSPYWGAGLRVTHGARFTRIVPAYDRPLECLAAFGHMVTGEHVEQDAWLCERPNELGGVVVFDLRVDAMMLGGVRQRIVTRHSKGYDRRKEA